MKRLEIMSLVLYGLECLKAGERVQIPKIKLEEVKKSILSINMKSKDIEKSPEFVLALEKVMAALDIMREVDVDTLPDDIRSTLIKGLYELKYEISVICYNYFYVHEFEVNDSTKTLMREVYKTYTEGRD